MMADPQKEAETTTATQQVQEQHMEAETSTQAKKTEEPTKPKCKRKVKERKELLNSSSISSNDIGLKIYSADSRGWPEGKISKESLIKGIEEGTYKYTYTNTALKEGEVMMKIVFNQLNTEDCFATLEDSIFNRLTSGLTDEHSPIRQKTKRHRTSSK